jgi:pimeloyl-ACP methyl ester carboxylesterase
MRRIPYRGRAEVPMPGPVGHAAAPDWCERTGIVAGDGLHLRFYEWGPPGDPEPVVLLHGIAGSAHDWLGVARALAPLRRVIALDARGHGASDWSAEEAYAPDQHFADLCIALKTLGAERSTVAGFSMGGALATMFAAALPEQTKALVVVDAYPDPEMTPGSRRIAEFISARYRLGTNGLPAGFDPAIARRLSEELASGAPRRLDLWPFWEVAAAPALLVRGALSDVLTAPLAQRMLDRRPGASLLTVDGVAHQIPQRRPIELARGILGLG